MQIEELNSYTQLFDTYGKLLSKKQFETMDKFLNLDLSETELAEYENLSRQSVHDAISKAKKQLQEFEEKCRVVESKNKIKESLEQIKANLTDEKVIKQIEMLIEDI